MVWRRHGYSILLSAVLAQETDPVAVRSGSLVVRIAVVEDDHGNLTPMPGQVPGANFTAVEHRNEADQDDSYGADQKRDALASLSRVHERSWRAVRAHFIPFTLCIPRSSSTNFCCGQCMTNSV